MFCFVNFLFFFFKQKTAYEMRISDWSSDVCSSDLIGDAVNTAARLERLAKTLDQAGGTGACGKIIVGEATWRRLGGRYRGVPIGPVSLKGKLGTIDAYRLLGLAGGFEAGAGSEGAVQ